MEFVKERRERKRVSFIVQIMVTNRRAAQRKLSLHGRGERKKGRSVNSWAMGRYRKPRASNSSGD